MFNIDHIQFNHFIYEHATDLALLLYELNGPSIVIPLRNADLMCFIRVFNNIIQCQNHINTNHEKRITLFGYDGNIQQWLAGNTTIPNNLKSMKIFCGSDDWFFVTRRVENYREKFENTVFHMITFDDLNHELLSFGVKYIRDLRKKFREDFGILNLLDQDYKKICKTLEGHASRRADIEYERVRQSEEVQH